VKLSVVILTYNSRKHLEEVLSSALFADEVLILDGYSDDGSVEIARSLGVRVEFSQWLGFGRQKRRAVELAKNDWVFVLDSDEVITPQLEEEIKRVLENPQKSAYRVPRLNIFFGRRMRHGGLYPDATVRLFDRRRCNFDEKEVHEKVVVDERDTGELKNHMLHYAYDSVEEFIAKQNRYSTLGAKENRLKAILNPAWTFLRIYILKAGFLDGWQGYVTARLYAQYTFWKYIKERG